jgi:Ca-activated chloride channel family protein
MGKLKGVPGRKMILIVSDGLDNGSRMHLEEALKAVQETNTIVYGICYDQKFFGCAFMKSLAEPTGGRMFDAGKKRKSLGEIYQTIEDELRSQYAIGYVPINQEHDGKVTTRRLEPNNALDLDEARRSGAPGHERA